VAVAPAGPAEPGDRRGDLGWLDEPLDQLFGRERPGALEVVEAGALGEPTGRVVPEDPSPDPLRSLPRAIVDDDHRPFRGKRRDQRALSTRLAKTGYMAEGCWTPTSRDGSKSSNHRDGDRGMRLSGV
jgi:hypothetical protein